MNILVACDSFKDALPADAVCRAIAAGLKRAHPDAMVTEMPLSDERPNIYPCPHRDLL